MEIRRLLAPSGSLYLHLDAREVHYVKVLCDGIFGRDCFLNEIVWAYDYGGRPTRRWPAKHDTILLYVKDADQYTFNRDDIDRIPYMAPGLVGPEKAARGKLPTDTWWHTVVPTQRRRAHRLPHAEARGAGGAHHPRLEQPGRPGLRPLRGQRHGGGRRGAAGASLPADRREPGRDRRDAGSPGAGDRLRRGVRSRHRGAGGI